MIFCDELLESLDGFTAADEAQRCQGFTAQGSVFFRGGKLSECGDEFSLLPLTREADGGELHVTRSRFQKRSDGAEVALRTEAALLRSLSKGTRSAKTSGRLELGLIHEGCEECVHFSLPTGFADELDPRATACGVDAASGKEALHVRRSDDGIGDGGERGELLVTPFDLLGMIGELGKPGAREFVHRRPGGEVEEAVAGIGGHVFQHEIRALKGADATQRTEGLQACARILPGLHPGGDGADVSDATIAVGLADLAQGDLHAGVVLTRLQHGEEMRDIVRATTEQPRGVTASDLIFDPNGERFLQVGKWGLSKLAASLLELPAARRKQLGQQGIHRQACDRLPGDRLAALRCDAPDAAALLVAAWITEIDFTMIDDRIGPVRDIQAAIRSHGERDGSEGRIVGAGDIGLSLRDVAGLWRRLVRREVGEVKPHDAMGAEVVGDGAALPFRAKERAIHELETAELRIRAGADAADETAGTFARWQHGTGEAPAHAIAIRTRSEESLAIEIFLLAPAVHEALGVDFQTLGVWIISKSHAAVGPHEAPRGLDVGVDVNRLLEIEPTINAPMQAVDDVMRVLRAETTEHDATLAEQTIRAGLAELKQLRARAHKAASPIVRRDTTRDEQLVRDDARDIGHAIAIRVFEQDDAVIAGRGAKLGAVAFHLRTQVIRVHLRVSVRRGDPQASGGIPVHAHGFFQQRILREGCHRQSLIEREIGCGQRGKHGQFRGARWLRWQRARLACGDADDIGLSLVHERIKLGNLHRVATLLAFTEAEDVGVVRRTAAMKEERVLAQDGLPQRALLGRLRIPLGPIRFPAELRREALTQRLKSPGVQVDAVVRAMRQINAGRLLPLTAHKGRLLFSGELLHDFFILSKQGIVLRRIRQARPHGTQVFMLDRAEKNKAHFALRTCRFDQIHQREQLCAKLRRAVIHTITHRVGIEHRIILSIGQIIQTRRHAITQDRHRRLHHRELLLQRLHALIHRIKARPRSSQWAVATVTQIAHRKALASKLAPQFGFEVAIVILALDEHVANQQHAVAIVDFKFAFSRACDGGKEEKSDERSKHGGWVESGDRPTVSRGEIPQQVLCRI